MYRKQVAEIEQKLWIEDLFDSAKMYSWCTFEVPSAVSTYSQSRFKLKIWQT